MPCQWWNTVYEWLVFIKTYVKLFVAAIMTLENNIGVLTVTIVSSYNRYSVVHWKAVSSINFHRREQIELPQFSLIARIYTLGVVVRVVLDSYCTTRMIDLNALSPGLARQKMQFQLVQPYMFKSNPIFTFQTLQYQFHARSKALNHHRSDTLRISEVIFNIDIKILSTTWDNQLLCTQKKVTISHS